MIFRRHKENGGTAVTEPNPDLAEADRHEQAGQLFDAIDALTRANCASRDPAIERQILDLRHEAGTDLADPQAERPDWPTPSRSALPAGAPPPDVTPAELTPELLRAGLLRDGCVLVRGLVDRDEALRMAADVDRAFDAFERHQDGTPGTDGFFEVFEPSSPFDLRIERTWVTDAGGIWIADSPKLLFDALDAFQRSGLQRVITEYLRERPLLSINKCTLRRVKPDSFEATSGVAWHQDGAFLGDVRAVNVWLSLSRCGDIAPGMDIVPRRLDDIVPTGTEGATFDWSVSQAIAEEVAGDVGIARPIFEPGDVLLFDEMFLHATAPDVTMPNTRYAVESWFFGPSGFPSEYVPLAF